MRVPCPLFVSPWHNSSATLWTCTLSTGRGHKECQVRTPATASCGGRAGQHWRLCTDKVSTTAFPPLPLGGLSS